MLQFALSTWRAGLRGRSIQAILVLGALLMGVAYLASAFSPRQPQTVALDVGFSALRAVLVLLGLFWVQELLSREVERKTVILSVSYPVGRSSYLLGRYLGMLLLLLLAALSLALLLWLVALIAGGGYEQQFPVSLGIPFFWGVLGVWLDAAVVVGFALMVASFATVSVLPLALGICFAIGAKGLGAARSYILSGAGGDNKLAEQMAPWLEAIRWILPDLSRLDWRVWPMYGLFPGTEAMLWGILSTMSYLVVSLVIACAVFRRREFS